MVGWIVGIGAAGLAYYKRAAIQAFWAKHKPGGGGGGGGGGGSSATPISISGQPYFNGQTASMQQHILGALYTWYTQEMAAGQWPAAVQDPGLTGQGDLLDSGNFSLVIDAYQAGIGTGVGYAGTPGVLDAPITQDLGVTS